MTVVGPWTGRQICLGVGYIFPLYKSSRALRDRDKLELLQWITFWTVNAVFWVVELVGDTVVGWVPFYFEAKIALLLWLVLPQYHGARVLHEKWLAPTFEKHEEVIDVAILDIKRRASERVVQVCKDTAAIALRRGSGVVVQGQQYVAAQLVQQALGKLQQPPLTSESQELRVPAILSFLSAAAMAPSVSVEPAPRKSIVAMAAISEVKESRTEKTADAKVVKTKEEAKQEDKKHQVTESRSEAKAAEETAASKNLPSMKPPTAAPSTASRNPDKSKELVAHFKKLLVKGFQLKYYPSEGLLKHRTLRLLTAQSRYLVFETSGVDSTTKNKKSVTLFIHNVRRVAATKAGEPGVWGAIDNSLAFVLDNGKTTLLFEADAAKTRDLLVAGMRLLVNEHKRQDTVALATITTVFDRLTKQQAFDRMVCMLTSNRAGKR